MSISGTYKVNQQKQLVDLNGQSVNFDLNFQAVSTNGEPFEILVVDQATLDSHNNLQYKIAEEGKISGNVLSDKNIYQNYFLVLKSDNECEVKITIDKKEIKPIIQFEEKYQPPLNNNYIYPPTTQQLVPVQPTPKTGGSSWKIIIFIIFLLCGIGVGYYFYQKKVKNNDILVFHSRKNSNFLHSKKNIPLLQPTPQLPTPQLQLPTPQLQTPQLPTPQIQLPTPQLPTPQLPTPQLPTPQLPTQSVYNSSLLDRLNKLKI